MNLTKEEKNQRLRQWWLYVPQGEVAVVRTRIMRKCMISEDVFYNWLKMRTEIPNLACVEIEQVIKEPIFSSETPACMKAWTDAGTQAPCHPHG